MGQRPCLARERQEIRIKNDYAHEDIDAKFNKDADLHVKNEWCEDDKVILVSVANPGGRFMHIQSL